MGIFNFKKTNPKTQYIGRHQYRYLLLVFITGKTSDVELQFAINKDKAELDEVVEGLERIEASMQSADTFSHRFDVLEVHHEITKLIAKGNEYCVLFNNPNIEARCFKIAESILNYVKDLKLSEGESEEEAKSAHQLLDLEKAQEFVSYQILGGLLKDDNSEGKLELNCWTIFSALNFYPKMISMTLLYLPAVRDEKAEEIDKTAKFLLEQGRIDKKQFETIQYMLKVSKEYFSEENK